MHPDLRKDGRRRFLKSGAALTGLALAPFGAAFGSRRVSAERLLNAADSVSAGDSNSLEAALYGRRSRFVTTVRSIEGRSHPDVAPPRPNPSRHKVPPLWTPGTHRGFKLQP